jgi:hypothetical protein
MVKAPRSYPRARRWAAIVGLATLLLAGSQSVATADIAEMAQSPLDAQRRDFFLLPDSAPATSLQPWLMEAQQAKTFALLTAVEPETSPPIERDWVGLGRDSAFLLGYQAIAIGVLFLLPEDVSHWDGKSHGGEQWLQNVGRPTFDDDSWWVNYLAHPYVGAMYYIRARERGFGPWSSFAYSALASAAYEFGVEAFFERPSIQDLIVTPVGGALLGAFVFEPLRTRIRAKPELAWYDHVGLFLTDPIGGLNGTLERLFGIKSDVQVNLKPPMPIQADQRSRQRTLGFELSLAW